jgi:hypothetical protein
MVPCGVSQPGVFGGTTTLLVGPAMSPFLLVPIAPDAGS